MNTIKNTSKVDLAPENGLAGLKHWRQDALAGLIVALVSIPLSLGIAMASGAPPICGLTSEIIAGLIFPLIGGAYVTISGPAAGLAPILYSSITALGHGDMALGYKLVLPVIMFAGLVQLVLTYFKAAKFSYLIPRAAVQGMLTSIGLLIFSKEIPHFVGHQYKSHQLLGVLAETPAHLRELNPSVFITASVCLTLLFMLPKIKLKWMRYFPAHLVVVVAGIVLAGLFHLSGAHLVDIPMNPLQQGIVLPDFTTLFSQPHIIPTIIISVLALTFVDGTESLATIHAVDQIDPFRRRSNPHRTLFAMGVSNICSGFIGGLTIIPGIMKSSTNIFAGGRTAWANMYNAIFITIFLVLGHDLIRLIPIAALSAVLVHIAFKLAGPHQWKKMYDLGPEQFLVFCTTIAVTVTSDLLAGIASGIAAKIFVLLFYYMKAGYANGENVSILGCFKKLFTSPLGRVETGDEYVDIYFSGPLTCFNNLSVRAVLQEAAPHGRKVRIHLLPEAGLVDHSSTMYLKQFVDDAADRGLDVTVNGLKTFSTSSRHADAFRYRARFS